MRNARFIDVDGIRTRYFEGGRGENLVLVHGGNFGSAGYSADVWSLNFDDLSRHFHLYALDKLGQGYTDNPPIDAGYTMDAVIQHVYGFLRKLGIQRTSLVGHSRGALPVARLAVDHPDLVKCLVILDSNTLAPDDPSTPKGFYDNLKKNAPAIPTREYVRREPDANSSSKDHITADYVDDILKIALLPKTIEAERKRKILCSQFATDMARVKRETLNLIEARFLKAPTLIVWGFDDPSAPLKLGMDLLKLIAPVVDRTEFHVFNRAAHYAFRERAPDVNRLIIDFIRNSYGVYKESPAD